MNTDEYNNSNIVPMVDRVGQVMEIIYKSHTPIGISKIASSLNLAKATVFRILTTLHKWGFVEKYKDTDNYVLGKLLIKYGTKAKSNISLVELASNDLKHLALLTGETVNLGIKYGRDVLTVLSEEGESSVLVSKLIPVSPLHCSSIGKIFLSHLSDDELIEYFQYDSIEKRTKNTITTYNDFLKVRRTIIQENISYDNEEYEYGLTCIASSIKNKNNGIIAAVSVSAPTTRLHYKGIKYIKDNLISTVKAIEKNIEYL